MAGTGNVIGSTFEDLRDIIALIKDKSRVGVCIDTCHTFAAGYPLDPPTKFRETIDSFDKIVGINYLKALHLNDSKAPLASHRDLHQNIGLGFLGLRTFHSVMNEPRFEGLPLVLETPIDHKDSNGKVREDKAVWAKEIKLLESLMDMDRESTQFKKLEQDLADRGKEERAKYQEAHARKIQKQEKDASKGIMKKWLKKSAGTIDSD
jgi:AP endonuclease-1